jgi:hypothetical protein
VRFLESRAWLAGSGRSGTTWLGQVLAAPRGNALMFEPLRFWLERSPPDLTPPILGATERPYFRPDAQVPSWERHVDRILRGSGFTRRSLLSATRSDDRPRALWRVLTGKRLLIKEIRSNLMVGWLARTFDLRVVLLLRHPCATVASQASLGWGTKRKVIEALLEQPELVQDHLEDDLERLDSGTLDTTVARLAARWAVENRVALAMAASDDRILPVAYEDLLVRPRPELERIFSFLGWEPTQPDWRRILSNAAATSGAGVSVAERLRNWRAKLAPHEAASVLDVVRSLGIDLYDEGELPVRPLAALAAGHPMSQRSG